MKFINSINCIPVFYMGKYAILTSSGKHKHFKCINDVHLSWDLTERYDTTIYYIFSRVSYHFILIVKLNTSSWITGILKYRCFILVVSTGLINRLTVILKTGVSIIAICFV